MLSAKQIIDTLQLKPHPKEGGYFREVYRSDESIPEGLPGRYHGSRVLSTSIYYLLTPDTFSEMHRLASDEVFHFYLGHPVTMLQLFEDGSSAKLTLGQDLAAGHHVQAVVPKGVWQGAFLQEGGEYALMGTTVAPGFEYEDYESGSRQTLLEKYPREKELIIRLTHK